MFPSTIIEGILFSDNNDDSLFSQMSLGELAGIQVSDMESSYDVSGLVFILLVCFGYFIEDVNNDTDIIGAGVCCKCSDKTP